MQTKTPSSFVFKCKLDNHVDATVTSDKYILMGYTVRAYYLYPYDEPYKQMVDVPTVKADN